MKAGSPRSWASGCTGCSSKVEIFCVQLWVVWTKCKARRHGFHTKKQIKFWKIASSLKCEPKCVQATVMSGFSKVAVPAVQLL